MGTENSILKVLVVDDNNEIAEMLVEMLARENYGVETADSGDKAIEIIKRARVDMVLLDVRMPGLSGVETLEKIKDFNAKIPVVMMTAYDDIAMVEQAFSLGACDFIFKPFNFNDLIESMRLNFKRT
jgi:DNA-binding NtrC family response regulator